MERLLIFYRRIMPLIFLVLIAANTVLSLIQTDSLPDIVNFWDKAQHALAFTLLAVAGFASFPERVGKLSAGLAVYGALIEIMQATLTTTRQGDPFDWLADITGVCVGAIIFLLLKKIVNKLPV